MSGIDLRNRINHIVVATNFSDSARCAHAHAAALAKAFGARVTLLHVDEMASGAAGQTIEMTEVTRDSGPVREALDDFASHGIEADVQVVAGLPKTAIDKWVRANGADIVVMTKRNRGPIQERLLGSTTQRVLRLVTSPILVIHEDDPACTSQELPRYEHILAATDLSDTAGRGIRAALSIADVTGSKLTLVHVLRMPRMMPLGASGAAAAGGMPQQTLQVARSTAEAELSKTLRELGDERPRPLILVDNNAGEAICGAAESEHADLITIPTAGRTGLRQILLGSTAERVARMSAKPVLVFPRPFLEHFAPIETES